MQSKPFNYKSLRPGSYFVWSSELYETLAVSNGQISAVNVHGNKGHRRVFDATDAYELKSLRHVSKKFAQTLIS